MERDDIIEYSLHTHHSEEEGKKIRKNIMMVTLILSVITTVEVLVGVYWKDWFNSNATAWEFIKYAYIILTIVKGGYIVMIFMHLGDERKSLRNAILMPYAIFILYLLFILLTESTFIYTVKDLLGWV
ncbi:MAG: cytochrome C oxidase subunit IV family protein [Flavobacteriales bacterium]|nr:cytochrome C oxidase subunit IV family protein [Flavobacteriales bacterium]